MSRIVPDLPAQNDSPTAPTAAYRRARPDRQGHNRLDPGPAASSGHLQVQITLFGDTYAQRHQAKAAGYRWARGLWRHTLSAAVRDHSPSGRAGGHARLMALIAAQTAPFPQWSAGEVEYHPDVMPIPPDAPRGHGPRPMDAAQRASRIPIRLLTSLDALLATLQHTALIVPEPQPAAPSPLERRHLSTGWCAAASVLGTGTRYQLRTKVLAQAEADGRVQVDPVWSVGRSGGPWSPLYPMTSRWLEAEVAGTVVLGRRLTLG